MLIGVIPQQEVVAALGQVFQGGHADPPGAVIVGMAVGGVGTGAADAVGVVGPLMPDLQAGIARGQQGAAAGGGTQNKVGVVHEEALGAGVARHHQGGNIPGADADFAGAGIEAAVRGDGAAIVQENIAGDIGIIASEVSCDRVPGGVVLHHDRAGENGGVGAVHSDAAAVPLGFVILNGGILDGGRALAVEVDAAAVAVREVAGDGTVFNEGSARAAAVHSRAAAIVVIGILVVIDIAGEDTLLHGEERRGVAAVKGPENGTA